MFAAAEELENTLTIAKSFFLLELASIRVAKALLLVLRTWWWYWLSAVLNEVLSVMTSSPCYTMLREV